MTAPLYSLLEAADFTIDYGFSLKYATWASGGDYVQHTSGTSARLSTTVSGHAGTYDLIVTYFDENDGASTATVKVDGVAVGTWTWDQDLGSNYANQTTQTTHVIHNVTLDDLATITLEGAQNGGEAFRIDKLELIPVGQSAGTVTAPTSTQTATTTSLTSAATSGAPLAFAGAEGFGATTAGGRGGMIVKVTNLDDSGVGSLRWALEDLSGPRIVVFDVGGTIHLKDQIEINGQVTIAGQTAPGEGITIEGARLRVVGSDAIIRGLHIRPGDGDGYDPGNRDAISVGKAGVTVEHVIIDHNSFSWALDENVATWGSPSYVTFSNNIIAEALQNSIHPEGAHSMGLLIGDGSSNISVFNNLLVSNEHRNLQVKDASTQVEFFNNLIYNYGPNGFQGDSTSNAYIIGNVYIAGADSASREPIRLQAGGQYYVYDNIGAVYGPATTYSSGSYPLSPSGATILPSQLVEDYVLANVGVRAPTLDPIDARILNDVINRTSHIIDSPSEVGGYLSGTWVSTLVDTDNDGIPDVYESIIGSDSKVFDAHGDADGDGYTNIEDYINGLIDGFESEPGYPGGTATDPAPTSDPLLEPLPDLTPAPTPDPAPTSDPLLEPLPDLTPPAQPTTVRVEAEAMELRYGFRVDTNPHASERTLIRASSGNDQRADYAFDGVSGTYDIAVHYFDENDGISLLSVYVNDQLVDSWKWDLQLGSRFVNKHTATTHTIQDIHIEAGDAVSLIGHADGGEPLRIDFVEFHPDLLM